MTALLGGEFIVDMVFIALILALLGLLAGAVIAFGAGAGESLLGRRPRLGRTLGGALVGSVGFATVLSPLAIADSMGLSRDLLVILGGSLFGMMIGLGITAPAAISPKRIVALGGGAVGGALGIVIWRAMGFNPIQAGSVPAPVLLAAGGLVGLLLAFSITRAEARLSSGTKR
jgi:hypothetical protein